MLDADHGRAELAQQRAADGSADPLAQFEHRDARQRCPVSLHARRPLSHTTSSPTTPLQTRIDMHVKLQNTECSEGERPEWPKRCG